MRPDRPNAVSVSVALLVATHTIGLVQMIGLSGTLDVPLWLPYSALAVLYSLVIFLVVMMMRGSQLARTIYTVVGGLGLVFTARVANQLDMVSWLIVAGKLVALILLYLPSSSRWFAYKSPDRPSIRRQA
ncbi:hypothetical protein NB688_003548 [Xanthomonas sacchari]|uniref:Uncharacterized protein n=1 Tax=Xanthomonas sacchari TaxID=56458 RepID=A0ABT3DWY5_9XANT|nr:hypothetical protein [Xanthomonas sacchari]MCW0400017.1 hypothetical protein [Xanthomonas sacchari]MCW0421382.1 hypothetical protein [Xanthomonas sacchari]UYK72839.1 hypothetical protein NG828_00330 [Xanthomonas sacchari]